MNRIILNTIATVFLILLAVSCLKDDDLNLPFSSMEPRALNDGLEISTPSKENIDSNALQDIYRGIYSNEDLWSLRSLLVFRNGKLVAETYLKDESDLINRHLVWSCTKQVIGILAGIAFEQGNLQNLDDPIDDYFDSELENHQDKSQITLRQLLTMRSGIAYENDDVGGQTDKLLRQKPDNSVDFILSLPLNAAPGDEFYYKDGDPHLFSAILQKTIGRPTDEWADDQLFSKIGIQNINWVRYRDGITLGGFGIETTPREMAKFGLLVQNKGTMNGNEVVSEAWISEMVSSQTYIDEEYDMGFYWWIHKPTGYYYMAGHGGQYVIIDPSKDLMVVMTAFPNTQGKYQVQFEEALPLVQEISSVCH